MATLDDLIGKMDKLTDAVTKMVVVTGMRNNKDTYKPGDALYSSSNVMNHRNSDLFDYYSGKMPGQLNDDEIRKLNGIKEKKLKEEIKALSEEIETLKVSKKTMEDTVAQQQQYIDSLSNLDVNDLNTKKNALEQSITALTDKFNNSVNGTGTWTKHDAFLKEEYEKALSAIKSQLDGIGKIGELTDALDKTKDKIRKLGDEITKRTAKVNSKKGETPKEESAEKLVKRQVAQKAIEFWANMDKDEREFWGKMKTYIDEQIKRIPAIEKKRDTEDAADALYKSGLGDTGFGKAITSGLNMRSKALTIGDSLSGKNGDLFGEKIANGLGLRKNGVFAKSIGAVAKGVGASAMAFSKLAGHIGVVIYALGKLGEAINAINEFSSKSIEGQIAINEAEHQQDVQVMKTEMMLKTESAKYQGDLALKQMEIQGKNMLDGMKIVADQYVKSLEISLGPLIDTITNTAYKALEASIDTAADIQKYYAQVSASEKQYANFARLKGIQYGNVQNIAAADLANLDVKTRTNVEQALVNQQLMRDQKYVVNWARDTFTSDQAMQNNQSRMNAINGGGRDRYTNINDYQGSKSIGNAAINLNFGQKLWKDITQTWDSHNKYVQDYLKLQQQGALFGADMKLAMTQALADYNNTIAGYQQQMMDKQIDIELQKKEILIDAARNIEKQWASFAKNMEEYMMKGDNLSNNTGINLGYTNEKQLFKYQQNMFRIVRDVAAEFGKEMEDVVKLQASYIETTGRQKEFSKSDTGQLLALGKYAGDDSVAAQYAAEMEIFNKGVATSVDQVDKVIQSVNKLGLNGRKYIKDLTNNLKLAQKYNFKEGTKSLMEMSKWAMKTRFNMQSLPSIVDKIQNGGLEDVIKQSAEFQVLGGMAAINSDPLGMLYDAWADPESLALRYQNMTRNFGSIDKKSGETKFNMPESMQIAQIAKIQGRSAEELRAEIMDRNKREAALRQMSNAQRSKFSDEDLDFLGSVASYDKKSQSFKVQVRNDKGEYESKDLSSITPSDLENILPKDHNERMEQYMKDIISLQERETGEQARQRADIATTLYAEYIEQMKERIQKSHEAYLENREEYLKNAREKMKQGTDSMQAYIEMWKTGNTEIDQQVQALKQIAMNIGGAVKGLQTAIDNAAAAFNRAANTSIGGSGGTGGSGGKSSEDQYLEWVIGTLLDRLNGEEISERIKIFKKLKNTKGKLSMSNWQSYNDNALDLGANAKEMLNTLHHFGLISNNYLDNIAESNAASSDFAVLNKAMEMFIRQGQSLTGRANASVANSATYADEKTYAAPRLFYDQTRDAIIKGQGSGMSILNSDKVTSINDGIVRTHKDDTILASKPGGGFDKLFNGVLAKAEETHGFITKVLPNVVNNYNNSVNNNGSSNGNINVRFSGSVRFESNGKSIDMNDPDMLNMLARNVSKAFVEMNNGGKSNNPSGSVDYRISFS